MGTWSEISRVLLLLMGLLLILSIVWALYRKCRVVVSQEQVAVVYDTERQAFSRFLLPGMHDLIRGKEYIRATISTALHDLRGQSKARTREGHPVLLEWLVSYRLDPLSIHPDECPEIIWDIWRKSEPSIVSKVDASLCDLSGRLKLEHLWSKNIQKRMGRRALRLVKEDIDLCGLAIDQIVVEQVHLAVIESSRMAQVARAARLSKGSISEAEAARMVHLGSDSTERPSQPRDEALLSGRGQPAGDEPSLEIDRQDWKALQNIEIGDAAIGKVVV